MSTSKASYAYGDNVLVGFSRDCNPSVRDISFPTTCCVLNFNMHPRVCGAQHRWGARFDFRWNNDRRAPVSQPTCQPHPLHMCPGAATQQHRSPELALKNNPSFKVWPLTTFSCVLCYTLAVSKSQNLFQVVCRTYETVFIPSIRISLHPWRVSAKNWTKVFVEPDKPPPVIVNDEVTSPK